MYGMLADRGLTVVYKIITLHVLQDTTLRRYASCL